MWKFALKWILVPTLCQAQVIRHKHASEIEYQQYLNQYLLTSYIQYYENKMKLLSETYEMTSGQEFFELAQRVPMGPLTREIWYSHLLKGKSSGQRKDSLLLLDPDLRSAFQQKKPSFSGRNWKLQLITELQKHDSQGRIFVNGLNLNSADIVSSVEHQFVFLSNIYRPIILWGTADQLIQKLKHKTPFIDGDCDSLQVNENEDWVKAFVSQRCIIDPSLNQTQSLSSTYDSKAASPTWLIPTLVAVGVVFAFALKDKHVAIRWP